jgi:hypothetical protein
MTEKKTFTEEELVSMLERQKLILALDHAIQRGKQMGDSPDFVNPLVLYYNYLTQPQAPPKESPQKDEQPKPSEDS